MTTFWEGRSKKMDMNNPIEKRVKIRDNVPSLSPIDRVKIIIDENKRLKKNREWYKNFIYD